MTWRHRANDVLSRTVGVRVVRAAASEGPAHTAGRRARGAASPAPPAPARARRRRSDVRPPADPQNDRLVTSPVFIISSVRSGSTLLRLMLNAHSQLHAPHEMHVRRLAVQYENRLSRVSMEALGLNRADLEHLLWDRVLHRELVRSGKQHIIDKTPGNAFAVRRLATAWPDARYIFLLRHPAAIAQSWARARSGRQSEEQSVLGAAKFVRAVEKAREEREGLTVRYEDLTTEPERETRRLCAFLGVPWEQGMLAYGQDNQFTRGLGDWEDKIRTGFVQPARALPADDEVPEPLREMCTRWGYMSAVRGDSSAPDRDRSVR